jgi:DNA-binding transcriptional LysR family regulator
MDASDLRVFEAVARLGGMNRAAAELHTVQSNVTARVRQLEDRLGASLFDRHSRGVALTEAGRRLLPYAQQIKQLLDDARRAVADTGTPRGTLTVGSLETTAAMRISPLLSRYIATYPQVDLVLRTGTTCELIAQVLDNRVEGAFVCGPVDHPDLDSTSVFEEELVLTTAPGAGALDALIATGEIKLVVLRAGCSYRQRLETLLAQRGAVTTRVQEFGTLDAILGCVAAGLGVTLLPRGIVAAAARDGRVGVHELADGAGRVETLFIRRRDRFLSSALAAFLAHVRPQSMRTAAAAE